jgi:type VI protein secretion system component Hcp
MRALTIGVVAALAASAPAFAGGKGGGGHTSTEAPKSSTSLNYNKVEWTYSKQKPDGTAGGNATAAKKGRVNVKDISVTKKIDKSSATLMMSAPASKGKGVKQSHRKAGGDPKDY